MSTDQKPPAAKRPEAIHVRTMQFVIPINIPGKNSASSCTAKDQSNQERYTIELQPWLRCFRIEFHRPGEPVAQVVMVHETHTKTWEPM